MTGRSERRAARRTRGSFVAAAALWFAASSAVLGREEPALWLRLPDPDLVGLETAVAEQLRSVRDLTRRRLADEDLAPAAAAEAVGDLGAHYHAYGLTAVAEECYRIAARLAPENFRWHYFLGYLLQSAGRLEDAERAYNRALAIYRAAPPALWRLGQVYVDLDRPQEAETIFREVLGMRPSSAAAEAALGELYLRQERYREAVTLLESALEREPGADRLYYPLALAYRGLGDSDRARQLLARRGTVGIKPADPMIAGLERLRTGERVHLLEGQAAFRTGRYAEAVEAFRRAVEAAPESVAARIDLGSALGELGESEAALEEFDRALEIAPANPTALFNAGLLRARHGEIEKAVDHLTLAAQLEPEDATIRLRLADVLRLAGDLDGALLHYRASAALAPPTEAACLGEAQVLVSQGHASGARDRLEECLAAVPTSGPLAHGLSRLLAMGPDPAARDGARSLELALRVYEARPEAAYAEVVAAAYAELGRCEEASTWQRRALAAPAGASGAAAEARQEILERYLGGAPCEYPP